MPETNGSNDELLKLTINGVEVESAPGRMLIDVAEEAGVFVPRFCYHPGMESVAACRMCLVQIEGSKRPLEPACATAITDGMVVHTDSDVAVEAQEAVLELLLINHPLDCPICDRGGECPLQDQTLKFGPGRSRYLEEKRHFKKPLPISDLVMLDRERCVLCWRCVRFCGEVSGDQFIDLMDRGSHAQINTSADKPFDSYFSGNTIQVCPVGALTSTSYRFQSRPWDLESAPSTCSFCAVGCPVSVEHRAGEVLRAQALPNENVNSFWNCDKGRFGHRYVSHPDRLKTPLLRRDGQLHDATWSDALDLVVSELTKAIAATGPQSVALIGGTHTTNEDLFAASRLFREVIGTNALDFRTFDAGFPYELLAEPVMGSTATIDDLDSAGCLLWLGPDPKEELPVLYLRIRKAVENGLKLVVVHPRRISLCELGLHVACEPGREAEVLNALAAGGTAGLPARGPLQEAADALRASNLVLGVGQRFIGTSMHQEVEVAARILRDRSDAKLLMLVPNANTQGAIDMGLTPHVSAGHIKAANGPDARKILMDAAEGKIKFLWLMGADLLSDFPDASLAKNALKSGTFVVVSELFPTDTARSASVVLPARSFAEKEGSFTNLERRIQKVNPAVSAPGVALADWQIFDQVAERLGSGKGWASSDEVAAEIAQSVPTHADFTWDSLGEPIDAAPELGSSPPERGAWPLSWELRAVDATKRTGVVWPADRVAKGSAPQLPDPSSPSAPPERPEGFPLHLLASRLLYDGGGMVSRSPELRNITPEAHVELNPSDADRRGISAGDVVRVVSERAEVIVVARVSTNTPVGSVHMPFDQGGVRVNVLMDASRLSTYVDVVRREP